MVTYAIIGGSRTVYDLGRQELLGLRGRVSKEQRNKLFAILGVTRKAYKGGGR